MRLGLAAGLVVLLSAASAQADKPGKVAVVPSSPKGGLLFETPPWPAHQQLLFLREGEEGASREYWIELEAKPPSNGDRFIVETLPPGRYRLSAVYQQGKWVGCLDKTTPIVSIDAGRLVYLGRLDTRPTLASIQFHARARNHLRAETFQWHLYRAGVAIPLVTDRTPTGLARASRFAREHMPRSSAAMTLADLEWGRRVPSKASGRPHRCD